MLNYLKSITLIYDNWTYFLYGKKEGFAKHFYNDSVLFNYLKVTRIFIYIFIKLYFLYKDYEKVQTWKVTITKNRQK